MTPERSEQDGATPAGRAPVAYLVFNRPRHTLRTFEAIRACRPPKLFIVADGPRESHPSDIERCAEVRRIVSNVDWPCEVHRDFSDVNLGCGRRVSSGLTWVFSAVERAVILEDDCLASAEFFAFCGELLERYRDDPAVWVVNGNSYQPQFRRGSGSYYFSKYPDTWGWATWRRAWQHFRYDLPFLEAWRRSPQWDACFPVKAEGRYFEHVFRAAAEGRIDTWDYQWTACVMHGGGLCATPNANLVRNIGFDDEGTHTLDRASAHAYEVTEPGALVHPSAVRADADADAFYRRQFGFERSVLGSLVDRLKPALRSVGVRRGRNA